MIKFRSRNIGMWRSILNITENDIPPLIEFENKQKLEKYLKTYGIN